MRIAQFLDMAPFDFQRPFMLKRHMWDSFEVIEEIALQFEYEWLICLDDPTNR